MLHTIALLVASQAPFLPAVPDWTRLGDQPYQYVGDRCENAGDVNGDGRDDLLVLATGVAGQTGVHGRGRLELFFGSAAGFSTSADWTVHGDLTNQTIDWDAAGIGDVNDDGFGDLAVASRRSLGAQNPGGVHVFYGGPSGPNGGQDALMDDADWTAQGSVTPPVETFGRALLGPGDLDGDGIDDLLVGAPNFTGGQTYEGAVFLFPGSSVGLTPGPQASYADATWSVTSNRTGSSFGRSLHAVGDVNGDGQADFLVNGDGGPQDPLLYGRHWVFTSATGGFGQDASAAAFASFDGGGVVLGKDVAAADFNQDGFSDIVLGFPATRVGTLIEPLQLWLGGTSGFTLTSWTVTSSPWFEHAGTSLAAGDIDIDGLPDLAVVSALYTGSGGSGRVRVFRGVDNPAAPIATGSSWEYTLRPGGTSYVRVEIVGDPEGDGTHALAVANNATRVAGMNSAGSVELFTRVADAPDACPFVRPDWSIEEGTWLGLRHEPQLADVNGDGYDDAVVCDRSSPHVRIYYGSPTGLAPNPSFSLVLGDPEVWRGIEPVAAGDVDGDGNEDVLLLRMGRTYLASSGIGQYVPAAAYLLRGDAVLPSLSWTATEDVADPVHFATAGTLADLDGDGCDDVVLGASGHERDPWPLYQDPYDIPGAVYVYYGGPQGVHCGVPGTVTNASWSASDADSSGRYGYRVRSAGNLDGIGGEELLVAAPFTRDASGAGVGALYLLAGGARGASCGMPGTAGGLLWSRVGTEPGGNLGLLFEAGVDVTGDGSLDLATRRMSGAWSLGLEVWNGEANGYAATPVFVPVQDAFKLLPDFTGDGIGDVCFSKVWANVRTPGNGRVAVLHGGADMEQGVLRWRAAGEKARVFLDQPNHPVRGDVNGDGRSDLLLTSKWYLQHESEDLVRTACYHGSGRALLELSHNPVFRGQTIGVGHLGGQPNQTVRFVPVLPEISLGGRSPGSGAGASPSSPRSRPPGPGLQRVLAVGTTDAASCWHTDWTVPMSLPRGTYDVQTVQFEGTAMELTSQTIQLVVR